MSTYSFRLSTRICRAAGFRAHHHLQQQQHCIMWKDITMYHHIQQQMQPQLPMQNYQRHTSCFRYNFRHEHQRQQTRILLKKHCTRSPSLYIKYVAASNDGNSRHDNNDNNTSQRVKKSTTSVLLTEGQLRERLSHAFDVLHTDLPHFIYQDMDFSIFCDNLVFSLESTVISRSVSSYKVFIWFTRMLIRASLHDPAIDILKIVKDPCVLSIEVRWRLNGIPRLIGELRCVDYISSFKLSPDTGLITEHIMRKITPIGLSDKFKIEEGDGLL